MDVDSKQMDRGLVPHQANTEYDRGQNFGGPPIQLVQATKQ